MSTENNTTLNATIIERINRSTFETPKGGIYQLKAWAEEITANDEGVVFGKRKTFSIVRNLLDDKGQPMTNKLADGTEEVTITKTITLDSGKVLSVAEILEAGSKLGDVFRQEEKDKLAANEVQEEE